MKVLVLYAYHESPESASNLRFFDRFGLYRTDDVTYCLIVNGETCSVPLCKRWSKVLPRENTGYDFNAWEYGLERSSASDYTHFVFLNDTVRGPFGDRHWIQTFLDLLTDQVKLVGVSINCHTTLYARYYNRESVPHVQSMFFCTDRVGLNLLNPKIFNREILDKTQTVIQKEIGLSMEIFKAGYNIGCILPAYHVDFRVSENQFINSSNRFYGDVWFEGAYFGRSLNPLETIFFKTNRGVNREALASLTSMQLETCYY